MKFELQRYGNGTKNVISKRPKTPCYLGIFAVVLMWVYKRFGHSEGAHNTNTIPYSYSCTFIDKLIPFVV